MIERSQLTSKFYFPDCFPLAQTNSLRIIAQIYDTSDAENSNITGVCDLALIFLSRSESASPTDQYKLLTHLAFKGLLIYWLLLWAIKFVEMCFWPSFFPVSSDDFNCGILEASETISNPSPSPASPKIPQGEKKWCNLHMRYLSRLVHKLHSLPSW